jgi:hypothetical protein
MMKTILQGLKSLKLVMIYTAGKRVDGVREEIGGIDRGRPNILWFRR